VNISLFETIDVIGDLLGGDLITRNRIQAFIGKHNDLPPANPGRDRYAAQDSLSPDV
jgi:hypothetical protein